MKKIQLQNCVILIHFICLNGEVPKLFSDVFPYHLPVEVNMPHWFDQIRKRF